MEDGPSISSKSLFRMGRCLQRWQVSQFSTSHSIQLKLFPKPNYLSVITSLAVVRGFSEDTLMKYYDGYYSNRPITGVLGPTSVNRKEIMIKRILEAIRYRNHFSVGG